MTEGTEGHSPVDATGSGTADAAVPAMAPGLVAAGGSEDFSGTVTLITGSSRGIGRSLAISLGARGGVVVINYKKNQDLADETLHEVRAAGGDGIVVQADMEQPEDIDRLFDVTAETYGRLDHFVCNAAASSFKPIRDLRPHHLDRSYAMNVRPFVLGAQRAVDLMSGAGGAGRVADSGGVARPGGVARTGRGRIVALSSYGSIRAYPTYANLGSAKAAIEAWVRYMATEFGPLGINVNAVNGGIIDTASAAYFYDVPGMPSLADVLAKVPKGRMGTAAEMSDVVLFLLSPASEYITGQTLVVDGGLSIIAPPFHADAGPELRLDAGPGGHGGTGGSGGPGSPGGPGGTGGSASGA